MTFRHVSAFLAGTLLTCLAGCAPPVPVPCVPTSCALALRSCGPLDDGCGATLDCGGCAQGQTCTDGTCSALHLRGAGEELRCGE